MFSTFLILLFASCEPAYRLYIVNDTKNELKLSMSPSIVNYTYGKIKDEFMKINTSSNDTIFECTINPFDTLNVYAHIGSGIPNYSKFPFRYVEIIANNDTMVFNSKEEVLKALNLEKRVFNVSEYSIKASKINVN